MRRVALVLGVAAASLLARPAWSLEVPALRNRVTDLAGLLESGERSQLESRLAEFERTSGRQFAVLIVPSLEGDPLEDFSMRVVEQWKLGGGKSDTGLLLLIVMAERKIRIEVGYGLEGEIPDAVAARTIRDEIQPAFVARDFAGGISRALTALMQAAAGEGAPVPKDPYARTVVSCNFMPFIFFLLFFGFPLLSGAFGRRRRGLGSFTSALIISSMFGRGSGWGGSGGGGFSGGGGRFGGGGASGGW